MVAAQQSETFSCGFSRQPITPACLASEAFVAYNELDALCNFRILQAHTMAWMCGDGASGSGWLGTQRQQSVLFAAWKCGLYV